MGEHICSECAYYMKTDNDYLPVNDGRCVAGEREDSTPTQEACRYFERRPVENTVLYF